MNRHINIGAAAALLAAGAAVAGAEEWGGAAMAQGAVQVVQMRAFGTALRALPKAVEAPQPGARQPAALDALLARVEAAARAGRSPVVMFDLDDTLIDTAYRQMAIVREFAAQPGVQARLPEAAARMAAARYEDVRYELADTLKALGVPAMETVLPEFTAFWAARFFDNRYLMLDRANPGAVAYVQEVVRRGGTAVYLTGRWEDMRPGTQGSMAQMGFLPPDGARVRLLMKPSKAETDIDFKRRAFEEIAALGEVEGGFENEPANVNAYQQRFPAGLMIFLDTRHSNTTAAPLPSVYWVGDFRR